MSARAIGTSTIAFGLVSIPVKLYSTGESGRRISFNMMHEKCGTRVKQQYICPTCDVVVPRSEMTKGYEFAKGQYVLFDEDELKALEMPKKDSIDIHEFVPADEVEQVYLDKPYYLGPDKGGARAYRLLSKALRESDRVAIATYATRGKQYLVMIRPNEDGLVLDQLRYAEEVRRFDEVPIDEAEVKDAEMELARQLIDQAASESFDATKYTDEVRERAMAMIEAKVEGQEIVSAPQEEPATQIIDLMSALKASLQEEGERKPAAKAAKKKATSKKKAAEG
ncbi:non-homologous end joining protein Ku [Gaopeijia maritima]|uniref:Non-homologous end joining protein Ku n=1 Tax=Gaopeijia maritima TaxID=3119007 RepID=A0ABU9EB30_9BACT